MEYDENSSAFKLWLIYTFRPFKCIYIPSLRKSLNTSPDMFFEYAPYVKEQFLILTCAGNVLAMPLLWFFATIWNLFVFTLFEVTIRAVQIALYTPVIFLFVIGRMLFVRFNITRVRRFLKYFQSRSDAWDLNTPWMVEFIESRMNVIDSNDNLERVLTTEYGDKFRNHAKQVELKGYPNNMCYYDHRASTLSAMAKALRKK